MLASAYPVLADGSRLVDATTGSWRLRLHDAFIVRYDAEVDGSFSLPEHRDTSSMSFTVALNRRDADFAGGGTWFEALGAEGMVVDADIGCACAFAGPLRHAGYPITRGTRYILVLFCYVEGFPYGTLVNDYVAKHGCDGPGANMTRAELRRISAHRRALIEDAAHVPSGWATHYGDMQLPLSADTRHDIGEAETPLVTSGTTRPSGDSQGGYVIYQQTTALVNMLNRQVVSVLE